MMFSFLKNILLADLKRSNLPDVLQSDAGGKKSVAVPEYAYGELMRLGRVAVSEGQFAEASAYFRQAVTGRPADAASRVALGFALVEQALYAEARSHLHRAILLDSENVDACYLLGKIFMETGNIFGAIEQFNEALALNPDFEFALRDLCRALFESGFKDRARELISKGIAQFPASSDFHYYQGNIRVDDRQFEDAIKCYGTALAIRPDYAEVHDNISHAQIELGRVDQAIASARQALEIRPDYIAAYDNLLWAMLFLPGESNHTYLAEARNFGAKVRAKAIPFTAWRGNTRATSKTAAPPRLRVGLVSGDLRVHAVGYLLEGVLPRLSAANVELMAYSMNPRDDGLTERIKGCFAQWTSITGLNDEQAARKIHADGVDILIDLAGHTAHNRLPVFAWKPAPVQVSWLGYLASTGVPGIDFVLADPVSAPPAVHDQFTEEIWRLPETFNCFTPPTEHPKLAVVQPPVLRNGHISFGSFQRMNKINQRVLLLWARILLACPTAMLRLQNSQLGDPSARARILDTLRSLGIASDRVVLAGETPNREDYLAAYAQVDIILDTTPYPGVTTTGEALWMGVPTVTMGGDTLLRRIGASLLTCVGLEQWVAWSEDEYVALAVRQSSDVEGLARLRAGLRQKVAATVLFDAGRFAPQFEDALFAMWRRRQG